MDLLAFSIGAENIRWKPEALRCTSTVVELKLNSGIATLQREISQDIQRPISIFWGPIETALNSGLQKWEKYPFKRSDHKISFSQAIFNALELPQAQGDGASNLTMHQLLRVLYADQPSVHSPIFRLDSFDSALTREMVGGYLCGVYDDNLYDAQLRLREVNKLLDKKISELRGIFSVLGRSGQAPALEASRNQIAELEAEREGLLHRYIEIKRSREISSADSKVAKNKNENLRKQLNYLRHEEFILKEELSAGEFNINDSKSFLSELDNRLRSLDEAKTTRSYFGAVTFDFCPCCLSEVRKSESSDNRCNLCSSVIEDQDNSSQILRMRNELTIQIKESSQLLKQKEENILDLKKKISIVTKNIKRLEKEYQSVASTWSSEAETVLEDMSRRLGALEVEISKAYEAQNLANVIQELQSQRDQLQNELNELQDKIIEFEYRQESRKNEVAHAVERHMLRLLKRDLPLQPEFMHPDSVGFDFVENAVYVNGSKHFSESSAVTLRHLFHLALFSATMELSFMRIPKFMMLDGIDDGGMEKERSHNLQRIIIEEANRYASDHQIIFATSEIDPGIEGTEYVVGRYFNPENRSLDLRGLVEVID